jgi:3-dehydroquinate synthetase
MESHWKSDDFSLALRLDKKRVEERIEFVVIDRLGHAMIRQMSFEDIFSELI